MPLRDLRPAAAAWPLCAAPPERVLRQRQVLAAARRAHVLIVDARIRRRRFVGPHTLVTDAELPLDVLEIVDVHPRRERRTATDTPCGLALRADFAVERDAELRRPLEDVKELAERQIEQREDYRDGVQLGQEDEMQSAHQVCRDGEEEAG